MNRLAFTIAATVVLAAPVAVDAQETSVVTLADTTELVFEREVFSYPAYQRRDPFVPLVDAAAGGPRFEELNLMGVVHHSNPRLSVVLFSVGNVNEADVAVTRQGAGGGGGRPMFATYRLRRGDVIGNTRIIEIREDQVIVEVEEFGLADRRILELSRTDEGGNS